MNNSLHLLLCHLPCPDIHPLINLPRVSIDNLAIIFLCELYREGSLATRRRSINHEEFWFIGGCGEPINNIIHAGIVSDDIRKTK